MLRIANVIEDGRIAGPQLRILAVAEALKTRDIQTTVIHPIYQSEQFAARLDNSNISRIPLPLQRLSRGAGPILRYVIRFPGDIHRLCHILRTHRFDFVHCSGGFWQIKGLVAAKLTNNRAVWHLNDTLLPALLRPLFLFVCRHMAHRLIFAGQRVRRHYLGDAALSVPTIDIQAPVNCEKFSPSSTAPDAKIAANRGLKIVTVANLNPLKGLKHFIRMAARLSLEFTDLSFHVVGPVFESQNEHFQCLQSLVSENEVKNIYFHGPSDDVPSVLAATDVYVCASIAEASPTSVWEAMAMARAIVSTDVGDVSMFLTNGVSGYVVPIAESDRLAEAVAKFIRNPALRRSCGNAARRIAVEKLDIQICVLAHEQAYK